jgi:hypothetical protein
MQSVPKCYKDNWSKKTVSYRQPVKIGLSLCTWEPAGNEVSAEAEESPLLGAVTRERLVKTQQTEKT